MGRHDRAGESGRPAAPRTVPGRGPGPGDRPGDRLGPGPGDRYGSGPGDRHGNGAGDRHGPGDRFGSRPAGRSQPGAGRVPADDPRRPRDRPPDRDRDDDHTRDLGLRPARGREPAPGPDLGHGHGHGPADPAGRRVKILLAALLVPCALASVIGVLVLYPFGAVYRLPADKVTQRINAEVAATTPADCNPGQSNAPGQHCVALSLLLTEGPGKGKGIVSVLPVEPSTPTFAVHDRVVLSYNGGDPLSTDSYAVDDFQRGTSLWVLGLLFAGAVIALGRWRGLAALVALGMSFVVLVAFMLPAILDGRSPLAVAVVGACLIMFVVLYLSHGLSARTSTAVVGTLVSLALIGVLGSVFTSAARLTGLGDDTTQNLVGALGPGATLDPRGLLLAGFVIGALGVLDDVTVTQTSAVWELRRANPDMTARELFDSAMRIGRDHVSSAVNTLVLAYAGASLPLLLLLVVSRFGVGDTLSTQSVATEVVRTLVGSIGLVASVPITTGVAALVASQEEVPSGRDRTGG